MSGNLNAVDEYVDALLGDLVAADFPPVPQPLPSPPEGGCDAPIEPLRPPAGEGWDGGPARDGSSTQASTAGRDRLPATPPQLHVVAATPAPEHAPVHRPDPAPFTEPQPMPLPPSASHYAGASAPPPSHTAPVRSRPLVSSSQRWLRVAIGDDSYALELLSVQEVVRVAPIVAMRGAACAVLGVMNLRGRIVPVFDLGLWLDAGCVHADERSRIVVVERDDELIGVLVTLVEDVVTLGRERIEPPLPGTPQGAILGIARVGAAPTVLLDAGALFAA